MDPYALLGIAHDATDGQIQKAYRKKARKCHPDKNPENPEAAAEIFKELQKALELLNDKEAKSKYDCARKAKEAARKRREELDRETKRARDELDSREKRAKMEKLQKEEEINRQNEKKRLQAEGSRLLEEMQEKMRQKQKPVSQGLSANSTIRGFQLVLRWSCDRSDLSNGGYSADRLRQIFSKYGEVTEVMVSSRKRGRGIVEFGAKDAAMVALEKETGLTDNPLQVKWTEQGSSSTATAPSSSAETFQDRENLILTRLKQLQEKKERGRNEDHHKDIRMPDTAPVLISRDRESIAMMKARQDEERQRLIEEMRKQDESENS